MGVDSELLSELDTANSANNCLFISSISWRVCGPVWDHMGRSLVLLMGFLVGIQSMGINFQREGLFWFQGLLVNVVTGICWFIKEWSHG